METWGSNIRDPNQ
jgi:hypothetical protein